MSKDRRDATRVDMPGMNQLLIDIKPYRYQNEVYINTKFDVTDLMDYLAEKKAEGQHVTFFHAMMAAIGKTIYNRPKLNTFIKDRHCFDHKQVSIGFVAKMQLNDRSEEMMMVIPINPEDTLTSLTEKIGARVNKMRKTAPEEIDMKGGNSVFDTLGHLPNIIRVPLLGLLKWMDKKDLIPGFLFEDLFYYSSIGITNLGAIKCGAIYHNLSEFGTMSALAAVGEVKPTEVLMPDGTKQIRQLVEFGITLDERIADGYYFAKSCKLIEYLLAHPQLLEEPAGNKVDLGEVR